MQKSQTPTANTILRFFACATLVVLTGVAAAQNPSVNPKVMVNQPNGPTTRTDVLEWSHLSATQRLALQPLAASWPSLSETQKKKWIALSANYATLSAPDKDRLRARMVEWAALTPKQRTQARLNFSQTQAVTAEDKAERWEIYQSLTPEQKRALAASAPKVPLAPHVKVPRKPASAPATH